MRLVSKTLIIMTLLYCGIVKSEACVSEKEEELTNKSKEMLSLKTEKDMTMGFTDYFEESDFLNSQKIKVGENVYGWHVYDSYRDLLSKRLDLHDNVLNALNGLRTKIAEWDSDLCKKVVGFSLSICGERVSIEPFLGANAP